MDIIKNSYTEIVSKTTLSQSKVIEYNLVVPFGVKHIVLGSGLGKIVELYDEINIISAQKITVLDSLFVNYEKMLDNNDNTYASRGSLGSGSTDLFIVDLGTQLDTLLFLKIATYNYGGVVLAIYGSNDNVNWTEIWNWTRSDGGAYATWATKYDSVQCNYRYIKFTLTNTSISGGVAARIYTLDIFDFNSSDNIVYLTQDNPAGMFKVSRHGQIVHIGIITENVVSYRVLEWDYVSSNIITFEEVV